MGMDKLPLVRKYTGFQKTGLNQGKPSIFLELKEGISGTHFENVLDGKDFQMLESGHNLVFTGEEPLNHQSEIFGFVEYMGRFINSHIEIETKCEVIPEMEIMEVVDFWNCKPDINSLVDLFPLQKISFLENSFFTFEVSNPKDFLSVYKKYQNVLDMDEVIIIPKEKPFQKIVNMCKAHSLRFQQKLNLKF